MAAVIIAGPESTERLGGFGGDVTMGGPQLPERGRLASVAEPDSVEMRAPVVQPHLGAGPGRI